MSFLRRLNRQPVAEERSGTYSLQQLGMALLQAYPGTLTVSSIDEAFRDAATWQCVLIKAKNIAQLPADVVSTSGGVRVPVTAPLVVTKPSMTVSRRVWMFQLSSSMFTDGNAFGRVTSVDSMQRPSSIELFDPETVRERKVINGVKQVRVGDETLRQFPFGDLWHVAGEMVKAGSPFGLSPIGYGQRGIATALAAEMFSGQFFVDGGHPTALLRPKEDPGADGARALKNVWLNATRGNREPAVLPQTVEYERLQVDPKDSQFIETMQFQVLQQCRRHGVPPSMVYAAVQGQNVTYANVTDADLQFLKHSLSYPIDLIEEAISELLPRPRVLKLNRDAILRASPAERHKIHDMRLKNRTTSVNEVRTLEDEIPFGPEFDVPGIPALAAPAAASEVTP